MRNTKLELARFLMKLGVISAGEYYRRMSILRSAGMQDLHGWYIHED